MNLRRWIFTAEHTLDEIAKIIGVWWKTALLSELMGIALVIHGISVGDTFILVSGVSAILFSLCLHVMVQIADIQIHAGKIREIMEKRFGDEK